MSNRVPSHRPALAGRESSYVQQAITATAIARCIDAGTGHTPARFTECTLDTFFTGYAPRVERGFLIPGGRDKVYVLTGGSRGIG